VMCMRISHFYEKVFKFPWPIQVVFQGTNSEVVSRVISGKFEDLVLRDWTALDLVRLSNGNSRDSLKKLHLREIVPSRSMDELSILLLNIRSLVLQTCSFTSYAINKYLSLNQVIQTLVMPEITLSRLVQLPASLTHLECRTQSDSVSLGFTEQLTNLRCLKLSSLSKCGPVNVNWAIFSQLTSLDLLRINCTPDSLGCLPVCLRELALKHCATTNQVMSSLGALTGLKRLELVQKCHSFTDEGLSCLKDLPIQTLVLPEITLHDHVQLPASLIHLECRTQSDSVSLGFTEQLTNLRCLKLSSLSKCGPVNVNWGIFSQLTSLDLLRINCT
jgi:hypothetical protein